MLYMYFFYFLEPAYKLPEEMTRRRLDDPNYQTWRGLENIFVGSSKGGVKSDTPLNTPLNSKSNAAMDSKSNLLSTSKLSDMPTSLMENEKKGRRDCLIYFILLNFQEKQAISNVDIDKDVKKAATSEVKLQSKAN